MTSVRKALWMPAVYLCVAIALSGVLPLWLDEILQLMDTRSTSATVLLSRLPAHHTGSAPLGYLVQQLTLKIAGYSLRSARFPAAVFGSATVFLVFILAGELGVRRRGMAMLLFASLPMILRYSTEARMYSQALFFSSLAMLIYVRWVKHPSWHLGVGYCVSLTAAIYTQPYTVSIGLALLLWSIFNQERKQIVFGFVTFSVSVFTFLPWYLWASDRWFDAINCHVTQFSFSIKTPLMIVRELAGGGYWTSVPLVVLAILAIRQRVPGNRIYSLLLWTATVPIGMAIVVDAFFGYFIAIRQFMWILPSMAILAAAAADGQMRWGRALVSLLIGVCVHQDLNLFRSPRENWQIAADAIAATIRPGVCLRVIPAEQARIYAFFRPEIVNRPCNGSAVLVVTTPYTQAADRSKSIGSLVDEGYTLVEKRTVGKSDLFFFKTDAKSP